MSFPGARKIRSVATSIRKLVALLTLLSLFWTLTLAPALAALHTFAPPAPAATESTEALAAHILGDVEKVPEDVEHCACLKCGSVKTCCCKPADAEAASSPVPLCAYRAVCDRATADVSLPFLWWTALLPTASELVPPSPQGTLQTPPSAAVSVSPADLATPETPPRVS
jgi:hypothetical protein